MEKDSGRFEEISFIEGPEQSMSSCKSSKKFLKPSPISKVKTVLKTPVQRF